MMMMMVIFSFISAGLYYAARVPAIQEDLDMMVTGKIPAVKNEDPGRLAHITFIMFTFTSPLLLAGCISTGMAILRWFERRV